MSTTSNETNLATKKRRRLDCPYVKSIRQKVRKRLKQVEKDIVSDVECRLYIVRNDPEQLKTLEDPDKPKRPKNALDVQKFDWTKLTLPTCIYNNLLYPFVNHEKPPGYEKRVEGHHKSAKDFLAECLVQYEEGFHLIMKQWSSMGHQIILEEEKNMQQQNSCAKYAYDRLQVMPHPSILKIKYEQDIKNMKYGDRLDLDGSKNVYAYFVYMVDGIPHLSKYDYDDGHKLPPEAKKAAKKYHLETLLDDHECLRGV